MLVPLGDCRGCSSRTDVYPVIFQCSEWQVKRSVNGQRQIPVADPRRPPVSLYMLLWRDKVGEGEINDSVESVTSLMPRGEKTEF